MYVLTAEEVAELELCAIPGAQEMPEYDPSPNLVRRRLIATRWFDQISIITETTSRGHLAMRCHKAYLASLGMIR